MPLKKNRLAGLLIVIVMLAAGFAALYIYLRLSEPQLVTQNSQRQNSQRPSLPEQPPPPLRYPLPEPRADEAPAEEDAPPPEPLPPLAESDPAVMQALAGLLGEEPLEALLNLDKFIQRVVVAVDNLPRTRVPVRYSPVKPVAGSFAVTEEHAEVVIDPTNYHRYRPYIELLKSMDSKRMVALYVRHYPLFQEAYRGLGYPDGHFNDRLVEAVDNMLAAPDVSNPLHVVRSKSVYEYADADLEALSAGQKTLLRMGPENAATVKAWLRELRQALTGQQP